MKYNKLAFILVLLSLASCSNNSLSTSNTLPTNTVPASYDSTIDTTSTSSVEERKYNDIEDDQYDIFVAQDNVERYSDYDSLKEAVTTNIVTADRNFFLLNAEGYQTKDSYNYDIWYYFNVYYNNDENEEYKDVTIREKYCFNGKGQQYHLIDHCTGFGIYASINLSCIFYPCIITESKPTFKYEGISRDKMKITINQDNAVVGYVYATYLDDDHYDEDRDAKIEYLKEYLNERLITLD